MKTIIITLAIALFSAATIQASTGQPDNVKDIISKEITYPESAKIENIEGVVMVSFFVTDGKVEIETTNASNDVLKDYVIRKLKSLVIRDNDEQKYSMKFEFRLL